MSAARRYFPRFPEPHPMRHARIASATLLAIAGLAAGDAPAAAAEAPKREYTVQPTRTVTVANADAKQLAKVALFVTDDGGRSWRKDQELPVAPEATAVPAFTFTAPKDGAYGLWTVATARDGRTDAEPVAGAAPRLELVVDRTAPALTTLDATLGGVSAGEATLAVSWTVADPNLAAEPVAVEISADLGKTFTARHNGGATGTTALNVPVQGGVGEIQVRVIARDLAGNVLTSAPKSVALPASAAPADPAAQLAAAVAALPAVSELGVSARGGAPIVAAGESPLAAPAGEKPAETPAQQPAQPQTAPVRTAGADEPPVVADSDVEARYAREAGSPQAQPRGRQAGGDDAGEAAPARPAGPRAVAVDASVPYATGATAENLLREARDLEGNGRFDEAHDQYLRLQRSSEAKTALADHLAMLRRLGDHATIVGVFAGLPPELRTDDARLHAARANLRLGDHAAAASAAASVRASAAEAREALLVLGLSLKAQGRAAEARRVFDRLAGGNDEIAAQARAER
jgi:hypothetical protein